MPLVGLLYPPKTKKKEKQKRQIHYIQAWKKEQFTNTKSQSYISAGMLVRKTYQSVILTNPCHSNLTITMLTHRPLNMCGVSGTAIF